MGDESTYWAWRDGVLAHPEGRARGGEACVQCGAPVPPNAHWKHRDRHVCSPRCNKNLARKFTRMLHGDPTRDGAVLPPRPAPLPNPRTRPVPAHFGMLDAPFPYDFDGYGPMPGDSVTRFGSTTHYRLADMDLLGPVLRAAGLTVGHHEGPVLVAYHAPTGTAQLIAAEPEDLTPSPFHLAMLSGVGGPPGSLAVGPPAHWGTTLAGSDGDTYRWINEHIRDVAADDTEVTWTAVVCQPAAAPFGAALWSPAYTERSERLHRISATVARHARRVRVESGTVERFTPEEIYDRDGWVCGLCRKPIDPALTWPDPGSASLDHVLPLAAGGDHTRENTQAAHLVCNVRKGARSGG